MLEGLVVHGDAALRAQVARQPAPLSSIARRTTTPTSSSVSGSRRQTRSRERRAELTSK